MSNQAKNNNSNYFIDPTFTKMNRLFVLSFANDDDRTSFSKYYVPGVEIKKFNVLIDGKPFFDIPIKNKEEAYEQIIEMSKNNDYATGNLLDYQYFKNHYQLSAADLSKQTKQENPDLKQQIYFLIVTLTSKDNVTLRKQLDQVFKRFVYWNEYKSKIETKKADNSNPTRLYLDASFHGVTKLYVLAFDNTNNVKIGLKETAIENTSCLA